MRLKNERRTERNKLVFPKGRSERVSRMLAGALVLLISASCGYRLGLHPGNSAAFFESIAVPLFSNESQEPRLENLLTEAFRDRLVSVSGVRLCSSGEADALLKGTIRTVEISPLAVNKDFLAMEYRIRLDLSVSLERSRDGKLLWRVEKVEDEARFYASSDALLFRDNREEALTRLARTLAQRVVDQLLLEF